MILKKNKSKPLPVSIPKFLPNETFLEDLLININKASKTILISAYIFYLGDSEKNKALSVANALYMAARRGVRVKILLENQNDTDSRKAVSWLRAHKIDVRYNSSRDINHEKIIVIDNSITYIGSHNLSHNALVGKNHEASVRINSRSFAEKSTNHINRY